MAATRLIPMHISKGKTIARSLGDRTNYAKNPDKTEKGRLVTGYQCDPLTVDEEFLLSKRRYEQITGRRQKHEVIAYQIRQSFKPGEITADEADEAEAEQYLSKLTAGAFSPLMYESKATARSEFAQFRQMFLLIGGILCAIIGLVGLLNFFNAMMTGILSRRREFAVLQAVGMTNRQLKTMLIYEGLFYAMSSVAAAFMLSLAVGPLAGKMLGSMFWFFEYRFTVLPVLLTIPIFLLLGWLIPCMMYDNAAKCSVVEQLRDAQ